MLKIHSIETLGAHDGPGIRTVVFFQGCPMRCIYCHNPDTFDIDKGLPMNPQEIFSLCERYKNFYGENGGVTLSGGEPLLQSEGVVELLQILKKGNIHTALDTSGAVFCPQALGAADLVILDIKHTDNDKFYSLTGNSISNTLKTLEYLKANKKRFWIRQVIVDGYTDDVEQIKQLKELAHGAEKIELLPYHSMGIHKWEKLGLKYSLKDCKPPSKERMNELYSLFD